MTHCSKCNPINDGRLRLCVSCWALWQPGKSLEEFLDKDHIPLPVITIKIPNYHYWRGQKVAL